jgi:hypothetical protein
MFSMTAEMAPQGTTTAAGLMFAGVTVALIAIWWFFLRGMEKKTSGWDALQQKFPAREVTKPGIAFKHRSGFFGPTRQGQVANAFLLEFAQEGLLITPDFAKDSPILIPWSGIKEVQTIEPALVKTMIIVSVDYETRMHFHLPEAALSSLRQYVPIDRFRQPQNLVDEIKTRIKNRPR